MIELQHVSAGYGSKLVVEDISLAPRPGQVLTLLGPNGSGKSTLLRTIAGLHPMAGGQITVDGVPVKDLTRPPDGPENHLYASIPHHPQHHCPEDGAPRPFFPTSPTHAATAKRIMRPPARHGALGRLELADSPVQSLSGGQRQKVYLAMAMAQETQTILMDEPTTYLDIQHQLSLMAVAQQMAGQGTAVVLVLHDLCLALRFSDCCVLLQEGQMVQQGSPEEVFQSGALDQVFQAHIRRVDTPNGWRYYYD